MLTIYNPSGRSREENDHTTLKIDIEMESADDEESTSQSIVELRLERPYSSLECKIEKLLSQYACGKLNTFTEATVCLHHLVTTTTELQAWINPSRCSRVSKLVTESGAASRIQNNDFLFRKLFHTRFDNKYEIMQKLLL